MLCAKRLDIAFLEFKADTFADRHNIGAAGVSCEESHLAEDIADTKRDDPHCLSCSAAQEDLYVSLGEDEHTFAFLAASHDHFVGIELLDADFLRQAHQTGAPHA